MSSLEKTTLRHILHQLKDPDPGRLLRLCLLVAIALLLPAAAFVGLLSLDRVTPETLAGGAVACLALGVLGLAGLEKENRARKRLEQQLRQSEERYQAFVRNSTEGIWRFELEEPIPVDLPEEEQIDRAYRHAFLAECNDAMARGYGYARAEEMTGKRLAEILPRSDPHNIAFLTAFIRSGYRLVDAESHDADREGNPVYFLNSFIGVVRDGRVYRAWGTQVDVTRRRREEETLKAARDELEKHVLERTVELMRTNRSLYEEIAQRKEAEIRLLEKTHELAENERRWRTLVENVRLLIVGLDPSGRVNYVNPFFLSLTGYREEEALGRDWFAHFLPPPHQAETRTVFREVLEKDFHSYHQNPILTRQGEERHISWFNVRLMDEHGEPAGTLSIGEDVTDRLRTAALLRDSEEKFRSIAETAPDGILLADRFGKIVYWNKSARLVFGYDDAEVLGRPLGMLLPDRYREAAASMAGQLLNPGGSGVTGKTIELMGRRKGGREVPLELSVATWTAGEKRYYACIFRDVTERRIAEAGLRFQARILSEVQDAVIVTDAEGRVSYWNKGAENLYGHRVVDALGRKLEEVVRTAWPNAEDEEAFRRTLPRHGAWQGELAQENARKQRVYAACSVAVLRDETGAVSGHLTVARDITERKRLESAALQAEKMAAMGQMAAGVAHQLKAPLGVIYGYADLLGPKLPKGGDLADKLGIVKQQALRCANLVNNLLDFSRKHRIAEKEPFDLDAAVSATFAIVQPYALQESVGLVKDLPAEPLALFGNANMFEQVLVNLCLNGIDATPRQGKLRLSARKAGGPSGFQARIEVADTGKGIDPEARQRLFEPFFTTKESGKGTGLGLWLAKEIVTGMDGTIECESEAGRGTTFLITLPLAAPSAADRRADARSPGGAP